MNISTSIFEPSRSPWPARMLSVFRIVAGLMFVVAGTQIVFGYPPSDTPRVPFDLTSELGVGGLLEVFGGLAVVLGVLTRPVAFLLAGQMAVAYFQFHAPKSFFPSNNGGVPAVLYCFLFLYLVFAGAGAWSVDAVIARASDDPRLRRGRAAP